MRFRLDEVREWPVTWEETVTIDAAPLDEFSVTGISAVAVRGDLRPASDVSNAGGVRDGRETRELLLRLRLAFEVTASCSRCLDPATSKHASELTLLVLRPGAAAGTGAVETAGAKSGDDGEDANTVMATGDELDTDPLVAEHVLLSVPMRFVCRPDCPGLCPTCGARQGDPNCTCRPSGADSRWAALEALRHLKH